MEVKAMDADKDKFYNNPDTQKGERYQAWLKSLRSDMYINESVTLVQDLAHTQVQTVLK
jgi:carboxyl-terminal processing protease